MSDLFRSTHARFSPCRAYRYELWRKWGGGPLLNVLMLNPSTADETDNDPTVERCERRANQLGYSGLIVTNLFAFRATYPKDMKAAADPVGSENDAAILAAAKEAELVLCAWGNHGAHRGRAQAVRKMFEREGIELWCLHVTKQGQPQHPLYVGYQARAVPFLAARAEAGTLHGQGDGR